MACPAVPLINAAEGAENLIGLAPNTLAPFGRLVSSQNFINPRAHFSKDPGQNEPQAVPECSASRCATLQPEAAA